MSVLLVSERMDIASNFFWNSGRSITSFFSPAAFTKSQFPKGTPQRGGKYKRVGRFYKCRHLSRKRYKIMLFSYYGTLLASHIGSRSICVGSSDLERRGLRGQNFLANLHNYAGMFWARMTEFGVVTQVGIEKHISRGQPRSHPKGTRATIFGMVRRVGVACC